MGVCLIKPNKWKEDCREVVAKLYKHVSDLSEEGIGSDTTGAECKHLESLLVSDEDGREGVTDGLGDTASSLRRAISLLKQYRKIQDYLLMSKKNGWENITLHAATLCSLLLNVERIYELTHETLGIPGFGVQDFSKSFSDSALAAQVMAKTESSYAGIDFAQFVGAEASFAYGLERNVLAQLWVQLGLALKKERRCQSATRLFACAYNAVASKCEMNAPTPPLTVEASKHLCENLNVIGEYEMAAALCCCLLHGPLDGGDSGRAICDGLSPLPFGKLKGEFHVEMSLATALARLANGFERVVRAKGRPFAVLEPIDSTNPEYLNSYLEGYARLSDALRSIALRVMQPYLNSADPKYLMAASYGSARVALARHESCSDLFETGLGDRSARHLYICVAREAARRLDGRREAREAVLRLRILLGYLGTFQYDGGWYGYADSERLEDALEDLSAAIMDYLAVRSDYSAGPKAAIRGFEQDYNPDCLRVCASLLESMGEAADDDARKVARDAVMHLVNVAVGVVAFRRSCECVFPEERDYVSGAAKPRGQFYGMLARYVAKGVWGEFSDADGKCIGQLVLNQALCVCGDSRARESGLDGGPRISYYTSLDTVQHLFVVQDGHDSRDCVEGADGFDGGKNCLSVMHASYMNDPNEGATLLRYLGCLSLRPFKGDSEGVRERIVQGGFTFLKSFTTLVDQLHMWSMYGSDASIEGDCGGCCVCFARDMFTKEGGFALGHDGRDWNPFEVEELREGDFGDDGSKLYRVVYVDEDNGVVGESAGRNGMAARCLLNIRDSLWFIDGLLDPHRARSGASPLAVSERDLCDALLGTLAPIAFLVKDASYSREEEMRLLFRRPFGAGEYSGVCVIPVTPAYRSKLYIKPFRQVGIDEIILGPKLSNPHEIVPYLTLKLAEMRENAARHGIAMEGRVTLSKIDYR